MKGRELQAQTRALRILNSERRSTQTNSLRYDSFDSRGLGEGVTTLRRFMSTVP